MSQTDAAIRRDRNDAPRPRSNRTPSSCLPRFSPSDQCRVGGLAQHDTQVCAGRLNRRQSSDRPYLTGSLHRSCSGRSANGLRRQGLDCARLCDTRCVGLLVNARCTVISTIARICMMKNIHPPDLVVQEVESRARFAFGLLCAASKISLSRHYTQFIPQDLPIESTC